VILWRFWVRASAALSALGDPVAACDATQVFSFATRLQERRDVAAVVT
jgi:hypothetical protein